MDFQEKNINEQKSDRTVLFVTLLLGNQAIFSTNVQIRKHFGQQNSPCITISESNAETVQQVILQ